MKRVTAVGRYFLTVLMLWAASPGLAWGPDGHEYIATAARDLLAQNNPQAARTFNWLLRGDSVEVTGHKKKQPRVTETCHGRDLREIASWPDCIRYLKEYASTSGFHYDDIPLCVSTAPPAPPPDPSTYCKNGDCASAGLQHYVDRLMNRRLPRTERAQALAWIIHIVGDLHQPLHNVENRDSGGNSVLIALQPGTISGSHFSKGNLHGFWDTPMAIAAVGSGSGAIDQIKAEAQAQGIARLLPGEIDVTMDRAMRRALAATDSRFEMRKNLIEPEAADPQGFERIIGESDLMSVNYFDRGKRAAAAVSRLAIPDAGGGWTGTGFLVGPRLLMTNHHVLGNRDEAARAEAEFGYEHDIDGVLRQPVKFNLQPHEIFFTSSELDVTLVAVTALSEEGVPLHRYGRLPLIPVSGKAVLGEWVTIIQHPDGGPKQIAIRSNRVVELDPVKFPDIDPVNHIHYVTDTQPGSSGSPVLNDQWQVLALHHKAVPGSETDSNGEPSWIANEGVRISKIFELLEHLRFSNRDASAALDRLDGSLGLEPMNPAARSGEGVFEADRKPLPPARWAEIKGYDPNFFPSMQINLAPIYAPALAKGLVAPLNVGPGHELAYLHFSSVLHEKRKFPLFTAVNIKGSKLVHPGPRKDNWRQDGRAAGVYQPNGEFYEVAKGDDPVQFSRGHLVRLLDPCWSDLKGEDDDAALAESRMAAEHTFHYSNAAPQVQDYNNVDWGNLEDYLLDKAQTSEKLMTVFTGPIFRPSDPPYGKKRKGGPWLIPLTFWKIAILEKSPGRLVAAAFIIGQTQYVQALYEAKVFSGLKPYTVDEIRSRHLQTTVAAIEQETGLDFSAVRRLDVQGFLESTRQTRWINDASDIII